MNLQMTRIDLAGRRHGNAAVALRCALALALLPGAMPLQAAESAAPNDMTLIEAIGAGKAQLSLRYRFEEVDEDAFAKDAHASTLRLRLNYETAVWRGFSFMTELDHLQAIGADAYNSTRNNRNARPIVADPQDTDLNQAYLRYAGGQEEVLLGRQRINLANQRFIGGVGWRQNEQTFDAATLRTRRLAQGTLSYSYVGNVNRVFGPAAGTPPGDLRSNSHLLDAQWQLQRAGRLNAFFYLLDFDNAATLSSKTFGVLWSGQQPMGRLRLPWSLSYATQSEAGDNPVDYSAHYWQVEIGLAQDGWSARLGREVLSGDAAATVNRAFQTPLATLHLWQGWADKFLTTPPQGIEDTYLALGATLAGFDLQLAWHDFRAEALSRDYGTEWNVSVGRKVGKHVELLLKAARYDADTFTTDTTKLWASAAVTF